LPNVSEKVIDIFPPAYILFMIISGVIILEISPLHFLVPNNILYPFTDSDATNVLSSFAVIGISAISIGIISYLLDPYIIGNKGINTRLKILFQKIRNFSLLVVRNFFISLIVRSRLRIVNTKIKNFIQRRKKYFPKISKINELKGEPVVTIKRIEFYNWMQKKGYNGYYDFFVIRDFIARGFLFGFELAFISNFFFLIFTAYFRDYFKDTVIFLGISLIFFVIFLLHERKWKIVYGAAIKPIFDEYESTKTTNSM
jgi:hypothetical protein